MRNVEQNTIHRGEKMVKNGIDISHHQGKIDFRSVKNSGVDFVVIREGYRNTVDSRFFENVKGARDAGIKILGVYHFSYALTVEQAREEAKSCLNNLKIAGIDPGTLCFFDFEYDTVEKAKKQGYTLGPAECRTHTIAFCEEIKMAGYEPGVYTNMDYYRNWYDPSTINPYKLWLADYAQKPSIDCYLHQYSSKGSIPGIRTDVDLNYLYGDLKMDGESWPAVKGPIRSRNAVVRLAQSWIGKNEKDGSYKTIIDIYNSYAGPFPRGIKMDYSWAWCACTWSALAIALGYTDIMPLEISCGYLIDAAKKMGIWVENDGYIPSPGDAVLYDWGDSGVGDNVGWPDHVGVVDYVNPDAGYFTVVEGNCDDMVKKRTVDINGRFIRGFIAPRYTTDEIINESTADHKSPQKDIETVAREVISGLWGNGDDRRNALKASAYDYNMVQAKVNEILNTPKKPTVAESDANSINATSYATMRDDHLAGSYITTANLYCRNGAGKNKKALCLIPKGSVVLNYGFYTPFNGVKWLLISAHVDGVNYIGFSSIDYLKKM